MSSNVGLSTPRGSGTSGYVQRNLSTLKPRDTGFGAPYPPSNARDIPRQRQPDKEILDHDRKREVEVKVFDLRDKLEDEGVDEEEIDKQCDELREKLLADGDSGKGSARGKDLRMHQVHELAEAKIKESERLRKALGIKEGREGMAWDEKEKRVTDRQKA